MKQKAAFIGIGVMGSPMAGHLAKGLDMTVHNRTPEKAQAWVQKYGGRLAESPEDAVKDAEFVFLCVGDDEDLKQVIYGTEQHKGILYTAKKGAIIIDHTTSSPTFTKQICQDCKANGLHFIDAPVSGGYVGAENAKLAIMVGGDEKAYLTTEPFLKLCGKPVYMGEAGFGQLTKMMNQICAASNMKGVAEAIRFAWILGFKIEEIILALCNPDNYAYSWMLKDRAMWMVDTLIHQHNKQRIGGFKIWLIAKDLTIVCKELVEYNHLDLPLTSNILTEYNYLISKKYRNWDLSSIVLYPDYPKKTSLTHIPFSTQLNLFSSICLLFSMAGIREAEKIGQVIGIDTSYAFNNIIQHGAAASWSVSNLNQWFFQQKSPFYIEAIRTYENAILILKDKHIDTMFIEKYRESLCYIYQYI